MKITSKDLKNINFPEGPAFGMALKPHTQYSKKAYLETLQKVAKNPEEYVKDEGFGTIAKALIEEAEKEPIAMREKHLDFKIYGEEHIEQGALHQMYTAMKLPVTDSGALMPDAHQGYGLPIGGVLATKNSVIPYGVGVDIGCRMCLSIYDMPKERLQTDKEALKKMLNNNTRFGNTSFQHSMDHEIFERDEFKELEVV
ncbi:MAG: RtcB family protein, partial [Owenweeksia sp.]